jgi:signal peptidase I
MASTIFILLLAPAIAVLLTLFVFQSYQVDGPSMEATLQNNDRLIVWKLPRTWAKVTGHQYIPKRGDVIILNESGLNSFGSPADSKQLVKRVIGLPGDRVVVKDNVLTIYNAENPRGFQPDATLPYGQNSAIPPTSNTIKIIDFDMARAQRIARTETTRSIEAGNMMAFEALANAGVEFQEEWLSSRDTVVRPDHVLLDGEKIEVGGRFIVPAPSKFAGASAPHPSAFGIPELDIDCRCTAVGRRLKGQSQGDPTPWKVNPG